MPLNKNMFVPLVLSAFAMASPIACNARAPGHATYDRVTVPRDGAQLQRTREAPHGDLVERLKRAAASEAGDERFVPFVSTFPVGAKAERMLVAAITPTRGVFYYTEYSGSGPSPDPATMDTLGTIDLCRFTVTWDEIPGGAYAPGKHWAVAIVPFPDLSCRRPNERDSSSKLAQWRDRSAGASYTVAARGSQGKLKGVMVIERWPARTRPQQPVDGVRAAAAVAGAKDEIVRATPVSMRGGDRGEPTFLAESASGRTFIGIATGSGSTCLVEGLLWPDLVSADHRRRFEAWDMCRRLHREYVLSLRPGPGDPKIIATPWPPQR